ncbi:MAG: LysM peptidoglycan-binding domain-containing protein [Gemmatimonadaceae bacterium]
MRLPRVSSPVAIAAALLATAAPALRAQNATPAPSTDSRIDSTRARPAVVKHTVKAGDTLWEIAKFYLKDPFKWPQVFHANTDIVKNPHWIYPGQVLTIEGGAVKDEVAAQVNDQGFVVSRILVRAQEPTMFTQRAIRPTMDPRSTSLDRAPVLTVRPGEYDAAPYVADAARPLGSGRVLGAVETLALGLHSDAGFRFNDRLYISGPAGTALRSGDRLVVARVRETIPAVGQVVEPTGIVRVDSVSTTGPSIAVLVKQFGPVMTDQIVLPAGQSFEPTTVRPVEGTYPVAAKLLWIQNDPKLPSLQAYVILGAGQAAGVRAGDQFTLFDDAPAAAVANTAPIASGLVKVVRVTPFGATGIIVDQTQPKIREGMPAHLTAKMP